MIHLHFEHFQPLQLLMRLTLHQDLIEYFAELELGDGQVAIVHHLDSSL